MRIIDRTDISGLFLEREEFVEGRLQLAGLSSSFAVAVESDAERTLAIFSTSGRRLSTSVVKSFSCFLLSAMMYAVDELWSQLRVAILLGLVTFGRSWTHDATLTLPQYNL